jgi:hypothetical protein
MNATRLPDQNGDDQRTLLQDAISLFKVVVLLATLGGIGWGAQWLYRTYDVPVAVIGVDGELINVDCRGC